jgi:hypothetical protein
MFCVTHQHCNYSVVTARELALVQSLEMECPRLDGVNYESDGRFT